VSEDDFGERLNYRVMLVLGSIGALLLGLAVAYPLLVPDLALAPKLKVSVDVVYAYLGVQQLPSNVTGLWRNYSDPTEHSFHIVSYLVVLNVTNYSNQSARIKTFDVAVAPKITVGNGTSVERTSESGQYENLSDTAISISIENSIVTDSRYLVYYPGWDEVWEPCSSRLIGLSGITEVQDNAFPSLQGGDVYLYGKTEGEAAWAKGGWSEAYSLKHVQLQLIGNSNQFSALYNSVLHDNQFLRIGEGLDVYIDTRR